MCVGHGEKADSDIYLQRRQGRKIIVEKLAFFFRKAIHIG